MSINYWSSEPRRIILFRVFIFSLAKKSPPFNSPTTHTNTHTYAHTQYKNKHTQDGRKFGLDSRQIDRLKGLHFISTNYSVQIVDRQIDYILHFILHYISTNYDCMLQWNNEQKSFIILTINKICKTGKWGSSARLVKHIGAKRFGPRMRACPSFDFSLILTVRI